MVIPDATIEHFTIFGSVLPLRSLAKSVGARSRHTRPMGGWLMTYGKIGPQGGVVPTIDRDGHRADVASQLGLIDWSKYEKGGVWNDTHNESVAVGLPVAGGLEFHDATTKLAKAHGKVGFWTAGRLFDRDSPASWDGLTNAKGSARRPTEHEFARADHFWSLAHLLKGTPRGLGLSAHGLMALSPCGKRIIFAQVSAAAVCELPKNPDATLDVMEKGTSPLEILTKSQRRRMVGVPECGRCTCPPGACEGIRLAKADASGASQYGTAAATGAHVPEDLEGQDQDPQNTSSTRVKEVVGRIMKKYGVTEAIAKQWLRQLMASRKNKEADHAQ